MKQKLVYNLLLITLLLASCTHKSLTKIKEHEKPIFSKGERTPKENFTGIAWASRLVQLDETGTYSIGNVIFEQGARTNWHTHPAGQTLLVLDGKGWYQEKGKPARSITKGDVVVIPSNTEHWHGAAKNTSLTHLTVTNRKDGGVKWLQPVTDEEYSSIKGY